MKGIAATTMKRFCFLSRLGTTMNTMGFRWRIGHTLVFLPVLVGCMSVTQEQWKASYSYTPVPIVASIPASAQVEATFVAAPEVKSKLQNLVGYTAESVVAYEKGIADALYDDVAKSGIFTSAERNNPNADLEISIRSEQLPDKRLTMVLSVINPKTQETVLRYQREHTQAYNQQLMPPPGQEGIMYVLYPTVIPGLMSQIKAEMVADFKRKDLSKLGGKFAIGTATPASDGSGATAMTVKFEDLLVVKEASVAVARQRNRLLVAAKTLTVPALLREKKTAELTGLVVQIEQLVLDLNHEAEMEKDRAQRVAEQDPKAVEDHRELAVAYRERIEVLKPIHAALKEEIANRSK